MDHPCDRRVQRTVYCQGHVFRCLAMFFFVGFIGIICSHSLYTQVVLNSSGFLYWQDRRCRSALTSPRLWALLESECASCRCRAGSCLKSRAWPTSSKVSIRWTSRRLNAWYSVVLIDRLLLFHRSIMSSFIRLECHSPAFFSSIFCIFLRSTIVFTMWSVFSSHSAAYYQVMFQCFFTANK